MTTYHWEIQRFDPDLGGWRFTDGDAAGQEDSDLDPVSFGTDILARQGWTAGSDRRCAVWDIGRTGGDFGPATAVVMAGVTR